MEERERLLALLEMSILRQLAGERCGGVLHFAHKTFNLFLDVHLRLLLTVAIERVFPKHPGFGLLLAVSKADVS